MSRRGWLVFGEGQPGTKCAWAILLAVLLALPAGAEEKTDPALVGRWLRKSAVSSPQAEVDLGLTLTAGGRFVLAVQAQDRKSKKWAPAFLTMKPQLAKKGLLPLFGSDQVAPPKYLLLKVFMGFVNMPLELRYAIARDELTLTTGGDPVRTLPWLAGVYHRVPSFEFDRPGARQDPPTAVGRKGKLSKAGLGDVIMGGAEAMRAAAAQGKLDTVNLEFHHYYFHANTERWLPHQSDAEMIAAFARLAPVFKQEDAMHREDEGKPLALERLAEYRKLEEGAVPNSSDGMFGRGSSKRFEWLAKPPVDGGRGVVLITSDLDSYVENRRQKRQAAEKAAEPGKDQHSAKDSFIVYRHLEGNWYLAYEND